MVECITEWRVPYCRRHVDCGGGRADGCGWQNGRTGLSRWWMGKWRIRNFRLLDISDPMFEKRGTMADACYNLRYYLRITCQNQFIVVRQIFKRRTWLVLLHLLNNQINLATRLPCTRERRIPPNSSQAV